MKKHSEDFYKAAIKTTLKNTWDIRYPEVQGSVYPVFLADTPNGTTVCRFNDADIVFKNHKVSNLLRIYDIPAPQTRVRAYMDTWFETYDYCPDKTLYEYINAGASRKQIFGAYKQTIDLQNQILE